MPNPLILKVEGNAVEALAAVKASLVEIADAANRATGPLAAQGAAAGGASEKSGQLGEKLRKVVEHENDAIRATQLHTQVLRAFAGQSDEAVNKILSLTTAEQRLEIQKRKLIEAEKAHVVAQKATIPGFEAGSQWMQKNHLVAGHYAAMIDRMTGAHSGMATVLRSAFSPALIGAGIAMAAIGLAVHKLQKEQEEEKKYILELTREYDRMRESLQKVGVAYSDLPDSIKKVWDTSVKLDELHMDEKTKEWGDRVQWLHEKMMVGNAVMDATHSKTTGVIADIFGLGIVVDAYGAIANKVLPEHLAFWKKTKEVIEETSPVMQKYNQESVAGLDDLKKWQSKLLSETENAHIAKMKAYQDELDKLAILKMSHHELADDIVKTEKMLYAAMEAERIKDAKSHTGHLDHKLAAHEKYLELMERGSKHDPVAAAEASAQKELATYQKMYREHLISYQEFTNAKQKINDDKNAAIALADYDAEQKRLSSAQSAFEAAQKRNESEEQESYRHKMVMLEENHKMKLVSESEYEAKKLALETGHENAIAMLMSREREKVEATYNSELAALNAARAKGAVTEAAYHDKLEKLEREHAARMAAIRLDEEKKSHEIEERQVKDKGKQLAELDKMVSAAMKKDHNNIVLRLQDEKHLLVEQEKLWAKGSKEYAKIKQAELALDKRITQERVKAAMHLASTVVSLANSAGNEQMKKVGQVVGYVQQAYKLWEEIETVMALFRKATAKTALAENTTKSIAQQEQQTQITAMAAAGSAAAIPLVGWVMAPIQMALWEAIGQASVATIGASGSAGQAHKGQEIPYDGSYFMQKGEVVVPNTNNLMDISTAIGKVAESADRNHGGGGQKPVNIHFHGTVVGEREASRAIAKMAKHAMGRYGS